MKVISCLLLVEGEDDYTKILRIQSILETMKLIKTKRNSKAFILTPPILKGLTEKEKVIKSKLDAGNINDTQSKENQAQFNKVIRSPPNFLM